VAVITIETSRSASRKLFGVIILATILGSCSFPGIVLSGISDTGTALRVGEEVSLKFFTNDANFDSGIGLQSGASYALEVKILSNWIDSHIEENEDGEPLDERGFSDARMARQLDEGFIPLGLARLSKRSRQHRWFELMLMQYNCTRDSLRGVSDLSVDEESGVYTFVAACDGKLSLFVNDSHGFYGNNVGFANLSLSRVN